MSDELAIDGADAVRAEISGAASGPLEHPLDTPNGRPEENALDTSMATRARQTSQRPRTLVERFEAFVSRLSTRNNFWHKICSWIWLPYAFRSGITMKQLGADRFAAVLPFRRFNRNWYNAMAGAALLGNSEVAGGLYLFALCGSDYIVVCKDLRYRFLRPCHGAAVYRVVKSDDVKQRVAEGGEFNVDLEMEITQQGRENGRELRVGRCSITFHCMPKAMMKDREARQRARLRRGGAEREAAQSTVATRGE